MEGKDIDAIEQVKDQFLLLAMQAATVICCRVTPHQKAQIVQLIKQRKLVTLAIGDGGNDVSMIQAADIGVGIAGREGLQASRAADYSIAKFHFLVRLLLIHGRYSCVRTGFVAQYCFYKSLFICWIQILYTFYSGFSGTPFFTSFTLVTYNILFTGLPILLYPLDRDIPEHIILKQPWLYQESQSGKFLSHWTMGGWIVRSLLQSITVFFFTISTFGDSINAMSGFPMDYESISVISYTALILINTLTIMNESHNLTWLNMCAVWGTLVCYFIAIVIFNYVESVSLFGATIRLMSEPLFWLMLLLTTISTMSPVVFWQLITGAKPTSSNVWQLRKTSSDGPVLDLMEKETKADANTPLLSPLLRVRKQNEL
eukprot:TRINITY_DN3953_c0_g1_i1.p1 TRINITY_DN3953_c0_g1~~TRINITY_DN3953_c0_g1_i1.p1  ORF type:complete len:379 (-),score=66.07 TRINITY_DN3953_c0_g1_i1:95-1210(-)